MEDWKNALVDAVKSQEATNRKWKTAGELLRTTFTTEADIIANKKVITDTIIRGLKSEHQEAMHPDYVTDLRSPSARASGSPTDIEKRKKLRKMVQDIVRSYYNRVKEYAFPSPKPTALPPNEAVTTMGELIRRVSNPDLQEKMLSVLAMATQRQERGVRSPATPAMQGGSLLDTTIYPVEELRDRSPENEPFRFIIVAPPGHGKTTLVKVICEAWGFSYETTSAFHGNFDSKDKEYVGIAPCVQYSPDMLEEAVAMVKEGNVGKAKEDMTQWLFILDDVTLLAKKDEQLDNIFIALRAVGISVILLAHQATNVMSPIRAQQATAVLFRSLSEDNVKTLLERVPLGQLNKKDIIAWTKTSAANERFVYTCLLVNTRDTDPPPAKTLLLRHGGSAPVVRSPAPAPALSSPLARSVARHIQFDADTGADEEVRIGKDKFVVQGKNVFHAGDKTFAGRVGEDKFVDLGKTNLETVPYHPRDEYIDEVEVPTYDDMDEGMDDLVTEMEALTTHSPAPAPKSSPFLNRFQAVVPDQYYTPDYVTHTIVDTLHELANYVVLKSIGTPYIWEPCAGDGRMASYLQKSGFKVFSTDLYTAPEPHNLSFVDFKDKDGKEHKACPVPEGVNIIVTNPPYSLTTAFLKRAVELKIPAFFLIPINHLGGVARGKIYRELEQAGNIRVWILDAQPQFYKKEEERDVSVGHVMWVGVNLGGGAQIHFTKLQRLSEDAVTIGETSDAISE